MKENNEIQKFQIELDGIEKEASLIKIINLDGKNYAVYSVESDEETSDIFASEIIKDNEGYDKLIDIEDEKIRENLAELTGMMLS